MSFFIEPLKAGRRNPLQRLPPLMSAKMNGLSEATEVSFTRQTLVLDMRHLFSTFKYVHSAQNAILHCQRVCTMARQVKELSVEAT